MKKQIVRTIVMSAMMTGCVLNMSAQNTLIHEFSLYGGGGFSALNYQLSLGEGAGSVGGDIGVGYTVYRPTTMVATTGTVSTSRLGVHTGIGLALYNARARLHNVNDPVITGNLLDNDVYGSFKGDPFHMNTNIKKYEEAQNAMYLNIPVTVVYQTLNGNRGYYGMGGLKFGVPISGKFKSEDATFLNKGYYYELGNWAEVQEFAGFGTFAERNSKGNIDLNFCLMFSLEGGYKWRITSKMYLYAGVYFDYGLNNASKGKYQAFLNYDNTKPKDFTTNSVLTSYRDSLESTKFTEKFNPIAIGIKLRIAFEGWLL